MITDVPIHHVFAWCWEFYKSDKCKKFVTTQVNYYSPSVCIHNVVSVSNSNTNYCYVS